jgi:DNA polymerase III subunit beta
MKIATNAAALAEALALSLVSRTKKASPLIAHLTAENDAIGIGTCGNLMSIVASTPATIFAPGQIEVSADRLAALLSAFPADATVLITASAAALSIACGHSRYRLPSAGEEAPLAVVGDAIEIRLAASDLLSLFATSPAAQNDLVRYYFAGVYLHGEGGRLTSVATNGTALLHASVEASPPLPGTIVPIASVAAATKLIKKTGEEHVTLRRGLLLLEISAPGFIMTTRLIDATYPDYRRILPAPSANVAILARADLASALARLAAVEAFPVVAVCWHGDRSINLVLPRQPGDGFDIVDAETSGVMRMAFSLPALMALVDQFDDDTLRIEATEGGAFGALVIRTDNKFGMLTSCRWNFEEATAPAA